VTVASYMNGSISMKTLILPEWWLLWPMPVAFVLVRSRIPVPDVAAVACRAAAA